MLSCSAEGWAGHVFLDGCSAQDAAGEAGEAFPCSSFPDCFLSLRSLFVWPQELLWAAGTVQTCKPAQRGILRPPLQSKFHNQLD